jgi:hypothetical protein
MQKKFSKGENLVYMILKVLQKGLLIILYYKNNKIIITTLKTILISNTSNCYPEMYSYEFERSHFVQIKQMMYEFDLIFSTSTQSLDHMTIVHTSTYEEHGQGTLWRHKHPVTWRDPVFNFSTKTIWPTISP